MSKFSAGTAWHVVEKLTKSLQHHFSLCSRIRSRTDSQSIKSRARIRQGRLGFSSLHLHLRFPPSPKPITALQTANLAVRVEPPSSTPNSEHSSFLPSNTSIATPTLEIFPLNLARYRPHGVRISYSICGYLLLHVTVLFPQHLESIVAVAELSGLGLKSLCRLSKLGNHKIYA